MNDGSTVAAIQKASGARFRVTCWGDFTVVDTANGGIVSPRGKKARALLAYLVLHPGKKISRERLTGLLWGDRADEQARASLRQALVELKAFASSEAGLLAVEREHVSLDPAALTTDLDRLRALLENHALAEFRSALPDINDYLFANLNSVDADFDNWLVAERTNQIDALVTMTAKASSEALARGDRPLARSLDIWLRQVDPEFRATLPRPRPSAAAVETPVDAARARPGRLTTLGDTSRPAIVLILALLLTVLAAAGWWMFARAPTAEPTTIAVLPFKDLSGRNDPSLADGIAEEIMSRLSRSSGQRVIGRTSIWSFAEQGLDASQIGRKLNASYLVEGSVRAARDQIRVDVALVQTKDGARLWTEQFGGPLDDIFGIEDRIGQAISRRLKTGRPEIATRQPRGDAYALYLTARGLIHSREEANMNVAADLLRQAVMLDPDYAPAWASLGRVLIFRARYQPDSMSEVINSPEALAAIRKAIALQPDFSEAHLALGMALGPGDTRRAEFMQAVELDPNNAEAWAALALERRFRGEYAGELNAWRRAIQVDPFWPRAFYSAFAAAWDLGYRREAEQYARRAGANAVPQPFQQYMVRSDLAFRQGDFSGAHSAASRAFAAAAAGADFYAQLAKARAIRAMGDFAGAREIWPFYPVDPVMWRMWHNQPPTQEVVRVALREPGTAWANEATISFMLATLLNANRPHEAAALFHARFRSPKDMAQQPPFGHAACVRDSALIALALRRDGHEAEAQSMMALADASVRNALRVGRVPSWYLASAAQLWAVEGHREAALSALERAAQAGWFYGTERDSFADLLLEPAFGPIREDPRFQRLRNHFLLHAKRERDESSR